MEKYGKRMNMAHFNDIRYDYMTYITLLFLKQWCFSTSQNR